MANPWYIKSYPNGQWEVIYSPYFSTRTNSMNDKYDGTNGNGYQPLTMDRKNLDPTPPGNESDAPRFTIVNEQNRTYVFPHGKVALEGVLSINVSKSGTHRLNTKDGKKHIIPPGWMHIEFDAAQWTF